jgi:hypothetical protein
MANLPNEGKYVIGRADFRSSNLLEIEALLEFSEGFAKDVVFFAMFENGQRSQAIRMMMRCNDLRNICEGARELLSSKDGETDFEKFTKSGEVGNKLFFGSDTKKERRVYYLNIQKGGDRYLSASFDRYSLRTFIKRCELLAERLETALYDAQKLQSYISNTRKG